MAGGASSRMKKEAVSTQLSKEDVEQANNRSKGLIGVGDQGLPFLHYLLHNAQKAGYTNIYIVIGEHDTLFQETYGMLEANNPFKGLSISFARQYIPEGRVKPFGTADAVFQTLEQYPVLKEQSFTVCNSDNLYSIEALKAMNETESPSALMGYDRDALDYPEERIARFALMRLDEENHMVDIVEKPELSKISQYRDSQGILRVSMNLFKFDGPMFYPYLKNCPVHPERNEKELPTALLNMIGDHPSCALVIPIAEHVADLTSKDDIAGVRTYLSSNYPSLDW